jgi:predicted nucleotidyltransferase
MGGTASASYIRNCISQGEEWQEFVPAEACKVFESAISQDIAPVEMNKNQLAVLYKMRTGSKEELALAPDVSEGIENRIIAAAKSASTLEELYSNAKTKRYSHARIRRIVANSFLGITAEDAAIKPPYIRITGFNEKGRELVRRAKETAKLPLVTKPGDLPTLGEDAQRVFGIECTAGDVYSLMMPSPHPCDEEKRFIPVSL